MSQVKKAQCPICKKKFDQPHNVVTHLKNKYPCDKKCRKCGLSFSPMKAFKKHMAEMHPDPDAEPIPIQEAIDEFPQIVQYRLPEDYEDYEEVEEDVALELEPVKAIDYIPINDFNWEYLESIADKVEKHEKTISDTVGISKGKDGNHEVTRIQNIERTTILKFHAENAKKAIQPRILGEALLLLDYNGSPRNLSQDSLKLLTDVHARREEPRLLTMRAHCVDRKTTDLFARPGSSGVSDPYWRRGSKASAMATVKAHCVDLTRFLIAAAIDHLKPVLVLDPDGRRYAAYTFPMEGDEKIIIAMGTEEDEEETKVRVSKVYKPNMIEYDKRSSKHRKFQVDLENIWQPYILEAKDAVFYQLGAVVLDEQEVQIFLEKAKDAGQGFEITYPKSVRLI